MADLDQEALDGLGSKLESLDLTDAEQGLLETLLDRAAAFEPEVEGFASLKYAGLSSGADLSPMGFKLGRGAGLIGQPGVMGDISRDVTGGGHRPPPP